MGASFSDAYSFLGTSDAQMDAIPKNFEFIGENKINAKQPFPNMPQNTSQSGTAGGGGTPNFSAMSPPQQSPPVDELSARMESMRHQRDAEGPMPMQRI